MSSRVEYTIQSNVTKEAALIGLIPIRINVVGRRGWPDYGYMYGGRIAFIEFKRPGEKPDPLQKHVHGVLASTRVPVFIVDNEKYGVNLLKEWKQSVDSELERLRQSNGGNTRFGPNL